MLTQNGNVARQLIGNETEIDKEYVVVVAPAPAQAQAQVVQEQQLLLLRHGLSLDGVKLRPAEVTLLPKRKRQRGAENSATLKFVLREGRYRQIRRMCDAVGLEVLSLHRTRIGGVQLGGLRSGYWRFMRPDESFATTRRNGR